MNRKALFPRLFGVLAGTLVLILLISVQFARRGQWLPDAPAQIGAWSAVDMPLGQAAIDMLGGAPAFGRRYTNPFNERIECHVIATASFDAYKEPAMLQSGFGYSLTAEKNIPVLGKDKYVRAMILHNDQDGQRVLMYYWVQYKNGKTGTANIVRDFRDAFQRVIIGAETATMGQQSCIVRIYTQIHPADTKGVQARRNLNEVAQALYDQFMKEGGKR